jgi:D-alanyl-lipoteichoic acid acyltransferase DltB (MBOAT superfamily)
MTLSHLTIGLFFTFSASFLFEGKKRGILLFTLSILAVYALQPALPIRHLDFWLPTAALGLALLLWVAITPPEIVRTRENLSSLIWMISIILFLAITRYIFAETFLTASTPPRIEQVVVSLILLTGFVLAAGRLPKPWVSGTGIVLSVGLLIAIKSPQVSLWLAQGLRTINSQGLEAASSLDIRWLGFSYIAFRLIHTLQDSLKGRAPIVSLQEYITFILFYPALTAGPIDRLERFIKDLRAPFIWKNADWDFIVKRLTLGLLKKFILADSLALIALSPQNAHQIQAPTWAWILLYAYTLQIYLDFSGYTDLALALARLAGVQLPENFNQPYSKPNLTQFWNNWHMSLTQWFRAYVFNPLTRALRGTSLPIWSIILLTQVVTMILIGLWHGITLNFFIWGLWHGLGLFVHNRWQDALRVRVSKWASTYVSQKIINFSGVILTFHFVALGWVWFVLPTPNMALDFLTLLFQLR